MLVIACIVKCSYCNVVLILIQPFIPNTRNLHAYIIALDSYGVIIPPHPPIDIGETLHSYGIQPADVHEGR